MLKISSHWKLLLVWNSIPSQYLCTSEVWLILSRNCSVMIWIVASTFWKAGRYWQSFKMMIQDVSRETGEWLAVERRCETNMLLARPCCVCRCHSKRCSQMVRRESLRTSTDLTRVLRVLRLHLHVPVRSGACRWCTKEMSSGQRWVGTGLMELKWGLDRN